MSKKYGGLKLIARESSGPSTRSGKTFENSISPLLEMIRSPGSKMKVLSTSSLAGMIFTLDVDPAHIRYLKLNEEGIFNVPVTSYILKFSIIKNNSDSPDSLIEYAGAPKISETPQSFFEEAKLQEYIWESSVLGGRQEICPSVGNFMLFKNKDTVDSSVLRQFLEILKDLNEEGEPGGVKDVTLWMETNIFNSDMALGLILMPNVEQSLTLSSIINSRNGVVLSNGLVVDNSLIEITYANVCAQLIKLFLDILHIAFEIKVANQSWERQNFKSLNRSLSHYSY
jgi:hypothetical protein